MNVTNAKTYAPTSDGRTKASLCLRVVIEHTDSTCLFITTRCGWVLRVLSLPFPHPTVLPPWKAPRIRKMHRRRCPTQSTSAPNAKGWGYKHGLSMENRCQVEIRWLRAAGHRHKVRSILLSYLTTSKILESGPATSPGTGNRRYG